MAKKVKEMSDSIRKRVNEFLTIIRTNVNGQDIKLKINENKKYPICCEIMFSVQQNPNYTTELNPGSMISMLE